MRRFLARLASSALLATGASELTRLALKRAAAMEQSFASFFSGIAGLGCEATAIPDQPSLIRRTRKPYFTSHVRRDALVRRSPLEPMSKWRDRMRSLPQAVIDQMILAA